MALTVLNDTALHEAGHCFVAYLANDFFELEFVTADNTVARQQDNTSLGGIKGKLNKDGESLDAHEYDLMVLMSLAGMAADDINHSDGILYDGLYSNKLWMSKLKSNKYSGDFNAMLPSLQRLETRWKVDQREYTLSCQKLLHELFVTDPTKSILFGLRDLIEKAPNKTVSGSDIFAFFDEVGLNKWREENWKAILKERTEMFS